MISSLAGPRRAGPEDAAAIRKLTRDAYSKWIAVIGREPRPMIADYDRAVAEHIIEVLEDDRGLVALIEMIPQDGHVLIENIAVRSDREGNGLATFLLERAEELARALGLPEVRLYTNAAFTANLTFYFRRGFIENARTGLPDGGTMVHFAKPVS